MRRILGWAATAALVLTGGAAAQDYPSQDIRMICGFPPGSGADVFVRFFAEKLRPIVLATREAAMNAARHSVAGRVDVYAEATPTRVEVFVRDRVRATTTRVSVASNEAQGDDESDQPSISAGGRP